MATAITLNPSLGLSGQTNTNEVFNLNGVPENTASKTRGSFRVSSSAALGSPKTLLISHQEVNGTSTKPHTDRHVLRLDFTKAASGDTPEATMSVYFNIICPRVQFSATEVKDLTGQLIDLINNSGLLDRVLQSDVIVDY